MNVTHTCHTTEYTPWISYHRGQGVTQIASGKQPVKLSLKPVGLRAGGSEGVSSDCGVCVYTFSADGGVRAQEARKLHGVGDPGWSLSAVGCQEVVEDDAGSVHMQK